MIITSEDERAGLGVEQEARGTGTPVVELQEEPEFVIAGGVEDEEGGVEEEQDMAAPESLEGEMEVDPEPIRAAEREPEPEAVGRDLNQVIVESVPAVVPEIIEDDAQAAAKPSKVEQWVEQIADPIETEMAPAGIDEQSVVWEAPTESNDYGDMMRQGGHKDEVRAVSPQVVVPVSSQVVVPVPSSPQVVIPRPSQEDVEFVRKARASGE